MSAELHEAAGRHEEAISTLKQEVTGMRADLAEIKAMMNQAKGGWRTLMLASAVAGGAGGAIVKALAYLKGAG